MKWATKFVIIKHNNLITNKAVYTTSSVAYVGQGWLDHLSARKSKPGPTDGPMDQPTDRVTYRVACTRLKMWTKHTVYHVYLNFFNNFMPFPFKIYGLKKTRYRLTDRPTDPRSLTHSKSPRENHKSCDYLGERTRN